MRMSSIRFKLSSFFGYAFLMAIYYLSFCLLAYLLSSLALKQGLVINQWPFINYQKHFYFKGYRSVWNNKSDCVQADKNLIYSPKIGSCEFNNPEFKTVVTFTEKGRLHPNQIIDVSKKGIAIVGDSHAMGWGVNDSETFSNLLQKQTDKPIYNLAVSSYGTFREIKRLVNSDLIDTIDTVIIQYCNNDLEENVQLLKNSDINQKLTSFKENIDQAKGGNKLNASLLWKYIKFSVKEPFKFKSYLYPNDVEDDFSPHLESIKQVLKLHEKELSNKKIIVFYSNSQGQRFSNFPAGQDKDLKNLYYHDLNLTSDMYYKVDDHLKPSGHVIVANKLAGLIN